MIYAFKNFWKNKLAEEFDSEYRGFTHEKYTIESRSLLKYNVLRDDYVYAKVSFYLFRRGGEIHIDDRKYFIRRKLSLLPKYEIQSEYGCIAVIEKNKWFRISYNLIFDADIFQLRYVNLIFAIFQNDSLIGKRDSDGIYLPKALPFDKKMMIIWLDTYIHFQR
jgi:hypothetical protein